VTTTFVLATANADKVKEIREVLASTGVELLERPSDVPEVDETENTLEGNALLKARALVVATGSAAIADDTGLFVDALDGRPGVVSARYSGKNATYATNVEKLLDELGGVEASSRGAHFRTVIVVAYPNGTSLCVEGILHGAISINAAGVNGFGYDPVFLPAMGDGRTLAQLTAREKNVVSHRSKALRALLQVLAEQ
jgi:XTP/dITP diphosphohydrolase